ncbi:MAG: thermonuclease family protein [Novosphingobium sp.]
MKRRTSGSGAWQANGKGRRSPQLPEQWRRHQRKKSHNWIWIYAFGAFALGACGSVLLIFGSFDGERALAAGEAAVPAQGLLGGTSTSRQTTEFSFCHTGDGINCVVDGDTVWMDGIKIRVADIDAPETHSPRCAHEAELGSKATQRFLQLVNQGPFEARPIGSRDEDQYGRKLRVLIRGGRSLGDILVQEGLARTWDGARHPWC